MKLSLPLGALGTLALLAPAAYAEAHAESLPKCSTNSITPCACPNGTQYSQSVTFAVIGAAAADIKVLTSDFFNPAWFGFVPFATKGPNNTPGVSERTSHLPTLVGTYDVTELLTELRHKPDGSFIQKFELLASTIPIEYHSGNGSFGGYWVTIESKSIFKYETAFRWSVYACETVHALNYAKFFQNALHTVTSVLQPEGKIVGTSVAPFSIQDFLTV